MKLTTLKSVAIALGFALPAFGQTAVSPVVGYETINLNVGFNPIGLRFLEKPAASGTLEVIAADSVQDTDIDFSTVLDADTTYVLEIENATGPLQIIDTFSGSTLTTQDDLTASAAVGVSYTIRPIATIESVFGADNSAGLISGPNTTAAATIFIPDGTGGFRQFFFAGANLLESTADGVALATAGDIELPHDTGFAITSPAADSFVVAGDLKVTNTSFPLSVGFNPLASAFPVDATIASVFGADNSAGLTVGPNTTAADTIFVPDGNGGFSQFFFAPGNTLLQNNPTGNPSLATATEISLSDGYFVNSPNGNDFFTEIAPQVIVDLNE